MMLMRVGVSHDELMAGLERRHGTKLVAAIGKRLKRRCGWLNTILPKNPDNQLLPHLGRGIDRIDRGDGAQIVGAVAFKLGAAEQANLRSGVAARRHNRRQSRCG